MHVQCTCGIPECSDVAKPCQALDWEAVDEPVNDQDGTIDGEHDVLGRHVAAAVAPPGGKQDDHLDELRQREVHARGTSPLRDNSFNHVVAVKEMDINVVAVQLRNLTISILPRSYILLLIGLGTTLLHLASSNGLGAKSRFLLLSPSDFQPLEISI